MLPLLRQAVVLGAGTMGAQIAAHLANAGISSWLLDLPSDGPDRSQLARRSLQVLARTKPAPLYTPEAIELVQVGNLEDHLDRVSSCQWVIEAVAEDLEIKRALWAKVDSLLPPDAIASTNTSGLPVARIAQGRSKEFQARWLGTHFFNPPRYMKLLEVIPTAETSPAVIEMVTEMAERRLGKEVVIAKDRPNFIANRIGCFAALRAMELMQELDLTLEEVDELTGPLIGRPRTGTFRLADLIGLDVLVAVAENLYENLPEDPWRQHFRVPDFLHQMVSRDWKGSKSGQGFYRKSREGEILALDLGTMEYGSRRKVTIPSLNLLRNEADRATRLRALVQSQDQAERFLWPFFRDTLLYAADCIPEVTDRLSDMDRAMRWGFNWELGPFELWQEMGAETVADRARQEGVEPAAWVAGLLDQPHKAFYLHEPDGTRFFDPCLDEYQNLAQDREKIHLEILKNRQPAIFTNPGASLIDLGEGVACLEFHSKMNAIGPDLVRMAGQALEEVERNFIGLVVGNQGANFSAGANLLLLLLEAQQQNWEEIDLMIRRFQQMNVRFREAPFPVVAAPFHRVLGGGAEICLACDALVAVAETYFGLVEVGVGLIPAGGGCKEMLVRHLDREGGSDPVAGVRRAFEIMGRATVSSSAQEARRLRFLQATDDIEVHPDRLLFRAQEKVLSLAQAGYLPPPPNRKIRLVGSRGLAVLKISIHLLRRAGYLTDYDTVIAGKLAHVLTGGDINHAFEVPEQTLLDLEREAFLSLVAQRKTLERIQHTLKTGKPLRN